MIFDLDDTLYGEKEYVRSGYRAIAVANAEGRLIWKPMHMQPIYRDNPFVAAEQGNDVGADIFRRGLCLPSDNKMTPAEQDVIIQVIKNCFN